LRGPIGSRHPAVHWLLVDHRWRRRGVGRLLLGELERASWQLGYGQLQAETLSSWTEAVAFYEAMGFVRLPRGG
jgi:GNAT superfamily N-acetyltransferase